ncbi:MAG TPA: radical SAM protein [Roseiflexaceae bacterium]|nr:radical SAM protein [Roseiflexaceae bacterium]
MDDSSNNRSKLGVLLVQLPVPNNPILNTPLAAGYLKAYAYAQGLREIAEIEILSRALADHAGDALLVDEIAARRPDVLGLSLYTWNSERSLEIARQAKQRLPELLVVVGGPEVQKDNLWILKHPAVDVAVLGEGEQTYCELLQIVDCGLQIRLLNPQSTVHNLQSIPGLAFRDADGELIFTPDRVSLNDLSVIPSPYLAGYLDVPDDGMLMVEISRWCPYSCSFCLYGRNMGPKLGSRYFGLERVLAEIRWAREQGIRRIHFVEANLNLVPLFWPLMRALEDLNHDHHMTFYAELRGEHLTEEVVGALDRANVRYVEVGLQTANLTALKASLRRTDLRKWAAGTRRLYAHGIEVYLDVILGLPADDEAGIAETLDFIQREQLGPYDAFTLQVLPGTAVRQQAQQYGLRFQDRPPYYVLGTDRLGYADLWRLRRDLKQGAGVLPDAVEGMPEPRRNALVQRADRSVADLSGCLDQLWLLESAPSESVARRLAAHVDVVLKIEDLAAHTPVLAAAISSNPATIFDVYLCCAEAPRSADALRQWRAGLPFQPGYLDRVAVYQLAEPGPGYARVSPRCFLLLPWTSTVDPADLRDTAEVIWQFALADGDALPLSAWYAAGGSGVCLQFLPGCTVSYRSQIQETLDRWEHETGRRVWVSGAAY